MKPCPSDKQYLASRDAKRADVIVASDEQVTADGSAVFELRKPAPGECDSPDDVHIVHTASDRFLSYHDSCKEDGVFLSPFINKTGETVQGCFAVEKDANYPTYARLAATKREKLQGVDCTTRHVRWESDCSEGVRLDNVKVPASSQFEWMMEIA